MTATHYETIIGRRCASLNKLFELIMLWHAADYTVWEPISLHVQRSNYGSDEPISPQERANPRSGVLEWHGRISPPYRGYMCLRLWRDSYEDWYEALQDYQRADLTQLYESYLRLCARDEQARYPYARHHTSEKYMRHLHASWISRSQLDLLLEVLDRCCFVKWSP